MNLYNKINWEYLSSNPNAIELFKENKDKIDWDNLSDNPNAIKLLKERIEYENSLTNEELYQLQNKINRYGLCCNPSIFEDEQMPII